MAVWSKGTTIRHLDLTAELRTVRVAPVFRGVKNVRIKRAVLETCSKSPESY